VYTKKNIYICAAPLEIPKKEFVLKFNKPDQSKFRVLYPKEIFITWFLDIDNLRIAKTNLYRDDYFEREDLIVVNSPSFGNFYDLELSEFIENNIGLLKRTFPEKLFSFFVVPNERTHLTKNILQENRKDKKTLNELNFVPVSRVPYQVTDFSRSLQESLRKSVLYEFPSQLKEVLLDEFDLFYDRANESKKERRRFLLNPNSSENISRKAFAAEEFYSFIQAELDSGASITTHQWALRDIVYLNVSKFNDDFYLKLV
jgi:hypothetical protein